MELAHEREVLAHLPHSAGELTHGSEHRLLLEVAQHVMAVVNGFDLVQRPVEEPREVVLLAARGERSHDLIETQVGEELRLARARQPASPPPRSNRMLRNVGAATDPRPSVEVMSFHRTRSR